MHRLREKIRNDSEKYEQYKRSEKERYQRRKQAGKIKSIKEVNEREQRRIRENWRINSKKCYDRKKILNREVERLCADTPPTLPVNSAPSSLIEIVDLNLNQTPRLLGRRIAGKRRSRNNRRALKRKNEKLKKQLAVERAKKEKYKKRLQRHKKKKANSPSTSVNNMLRG